MLIDKNKCLGRKNKKNDYNIQCKNNKKFGNFCGIHKNYLENKCITINSKDNNNLENDKIVHIEKVKNNSKGSKIAKDGFKMEDEFTKNDNIKKELEKHYKIRIKKIEKSPNGKKYDITIYFVNNTTKNTQIKKFENLKGRGNSFDRRDINDIIDDKKIIELLKKLSFDNKINDIEKKELNRLCNNDKEKIKKFLEKTLIGENENKNDEWIFVHTNKNQEIKNIYIIPSEMFLNFIKESIDCITKKTCLHLTKNIYLQRKGNERNERNRKNDIQAKLKITKEILDLCKKINLNS